jgi:hypothetical protein
MMYIPKKITEQSNMSREGVNEGEIFALRKKTAAMIPIDEINAATEQKERIPLKNLSIAGFSFALFRYISNKKASPMATKGPAGRKYRNRAFGRNQ